MACDEGLVQRIRETLSDTPNIGERRMFGGVCFTLNGNMCCGVVKDEIMVRVGPNKYGEALRSPFAREMDFTGRPMPGYVFVAEPGCRSDSALGQWLDLGRRFALTLPAKSAKPRRQPAAKRRRLAR